jgi:hypothetical protein
LNIVDEAQKPKIARTKKTPKKADHVPEFFSIDSENDVLEWKIFLLFLFV